MARPERLGDIQINQDIPHESREWMIERIGWIVMALTLLAGLLGLLGPGPLSTATAGEKGSTLWVEYNRFERYQAPATLRFYLGTGAVHDGKVRLWLKREYVDGIELRHIDPEPERVEVSHDRVTYTFNLSDSSGPAKVTYHFEANRFWTMAVGTGLDGGPQINFTQIFYP
jgi:hypothetical protein